MAQNLYANMNNMSGHALLSNQVYPSYANPSVPMEQGGPNDNLSDAFNSLNMGNPAYASNDNGIDVYTGGATGNIKSSANSKSNKQFSYQLQDGMYTTSGMTNPQTTYPRFQQHFNWFGPHLSYQGAPFQQATANALSTAIPSSRTQPWVPSQNIPPVPELVEPRRTSWSSRDETSPQTPTYGSTIGFNPYTGRSPSNFGSNHSSTPPTMSPQSTHFICKNQDGEAIYIDFWALITREPAIPEPVPAIHSGPDGGRGTLDKILDNRDGTTNVYVRGLQPDTSDVMLHGYGERFGPVISCKSIIDASSGHCKGFGFIKYHNFIDAENCIRGFYYRGYEAKFARKSHNSRLKDLARPDNTNLYVSNLPRLYNEEMLKRLFQEEFPEHSHPHHQAGSCKILKDSCGVSRGVGFARFETSEICGEIIATFNNKVIEDGKTSTMLQIRYADTEEQKHLKAMTAVKRQFKADEYNEAVYGTPFGQIAPASEQQSPMQGRAQATNGPWINNTPSSSASPSSLGYYPYSALRSRQPSGLSNGVLANSQPVEDHLITDEHNPLQVKIESPSVTAASKQIAAKIAEDSTNLTNGSSPSVSSVLLENVKPSSSYGTKESMVSPTKSKL